MSARQKPAQLVSAPLVLPSVLDIGRQIVRLSDKQEELDQAILALRHQGTRAEHDRQEELERLKRRAFKREEHLVEVALGLRARTLGDVAVMLGLAWRVADFEAACDADEETREKAFADHARTHHLDRRGRQGGRARFG